MHVIYDLFNERSLPWYEICKYQIMNIEYNGFFFLVFEKGLVSSVPSPHSRKNTYKRKICSNPIKSGWKNVMLSYIYGPKRTKQWRSKSINWENEQEYSVRLQLFFEPRIRSAECRIYRYGNGNIKRDGGTNRELKIHWKYGVQTFNMRTQCASRITHWQHFSQE